jgi:hypothetical protein
MGRLTLRDDAEKNLFSMHRNRFRRMNTDANLMAPNPHLSDGHLLTDPKCFTNPTGQNQHIVASIWIPIRVTVNSSGEKESASPCSETPTGRYFLEYGRITSKPSV